jgi:hypothetical protein
MEKMRSGEDEIIFVDAKKDARAVFVEDLMFVGMRVFADVDERNCGSLDPRTRLREKSMAEGR